MDIVCLASQDWNSHLGVPQQIMARVAVHHRVVYVDPPRSVTSAATGGWRSLANEAPRHLDVARAADVIRVAAPGRALPIHALPGALSRAVRAVNGRTLRGWWREMLQEHDIADPLYWVFEPASVQHLPHLPDGPVVYDCIDHWAGYFPREGRRHANIAGMDREMARLADLIFVSSDRLYELHRPHGDRLHLQHHAADFTHFNRAAGGDLPVAPDLAEIVASGRKIIGLCGILDKRVDVASLAAIAGRRPDWHFVLVGPVQANLDIGPVAERDNVTLTGMAEVSELPGYVRGFDVCLIPYLIDDFVRGIYPLKLHEYLATGRPVVSTSVPAVMPHADIVHIGDGPDGLEAAILRALADDAPDRVSARIDLARRNSWDVRVAEKLRLIEGIARR
ncbi:MAG: glycosyltransferase [Jannaschia sp.]